MGSLGKKAGKSAAQMHMRAGVSGDVDTDSMKHMVMAMVAVALVLASVVGTLILSDVLHALSGILCASFDLPEPMRLT
ncbi:MAG: hypothetical protein EBS21_00350 [Sphingomonadaceae bacterium]|jgi:hypothetical protein|nr:hypothetical protein [Sphingomonadaceae bacterium]